MAGPGDELHNRHTGQSLRFLRTTAETGGALVEVETVYQPGSTKPVEHFHPRQDEHFEVLEGSVRAHVAGEERTLRTGDTLDLPPGTRHAIWNDGATPARLLWQTRPALRTEAFFEAFWGLAQAGRVTQAGQPPLLHSAVLLREFRREFRLARPPTAVQDLVFPLLAAFGRLRGYSAG